MVFAISQEQRADLVGRVADGLAGIGFHSYGLTLEAGSLKDKAEEIEARAFSVAEVASSTTEGVLVRRHGGERPIAELIKLYAKKAGELMRDEALRLSETAKDASPAGGEAAADDADCFDLSSKDREFYTQQRAEQVLKPLMAKECEVLQGEAEHEELRYRRRQGGDQGLRQHRVDAHGGGSLGHHRRPPGGRGSESHGLSPRPLTCAKISPLT